MEKNWRDFLEREVILMQKKKKPKFLRQNWIAYRKLRKTKWRKPRGSQSKLRIKQKSHGSHVSIGWRNPVSIRGLHPSGLREVIVFNLSQLEKINPGKSAVKIAHTVGKKKRNEIVKKAEELKMKILNK